MNSARVQCFGRAWDRAFERLTDARVDAGRAMSRVVVGDDGGMVYFSPYHARLVRRLQRAEDEAIVLWAAYTAARDAD